MWKKSIGGKKESLLNSDFNKMKRERKEVKKIFKEKRGPIVLVVLFLFVNIILYKLGKIGARTLMLSIIGSTYFSQHIEDFNFRKIKNYLFPISMLIIYIIFAIVPFQ